MNCSTCSKKLSACISRLARASASRAPRGRLELVTLHEPATFATDFALALLAGWLAWRLRRITNAENRAARWMARTLALTAVSGIVGGSYHGFAPNFSAGIDVAWWRTTLLTIDLLSATMAMCLVCELAPPTRRLGWSVLVMLKFFGFASVAMRDPRFVMAIADYGSAMIAWLIAAVALRRRWRGAMIAGIALSIVAALVQQLRLAPATWFNHNDLYHVIQAAALIAFYRAGMKF
jgi:hypothetical protein